MLKGGYRDKLFDIELDEKENAVMEIIDQMESDIRFIKDRLSDYKNLTEINEIYELARELCLQLY